MNRFLLALTLSLPGCGGGCAAAPEQDAPIVHLAGALDDLPDGDPEHPHQDSYRFKLGSIYLGADDHDQLADRFRQAVDLLSFELDPVTDPVTEEAPG